MNEFLKFNYQPIKMEFNFKENKNANIKTSISICGCAKNVANYLPKNLKLLLDISNIFEKSQIVIYENNSTDNTLKILKKYEKEYKHFNVISENIKDVPRLGNFSPRTTYLSRGRNMLLQASKDFEHMLMIDLDDVISKLNINSFYNIFSKEVSSLNWAGLGFNQIGNYYDLWALRTYDNLCNSDCWNNKYCFGWKYKIYRTRYSTNIIKKVPSPFPVINFLLNKGPIKVKSCFGGTTIYKTKYIKDCIYYGIDEWNKTDICEHVPFNLQIINKNQGNLYILPFCINH